MNRRLALLALSALAIAGPVAARSDASRSSAKPPVVFQKATRTAKVELRLPPGLAAWPAFRKLLLTSDVAKLNGFVNHAAGATGKARRPKRGGEDQRNWRNIHYTLAGTTPRLVSVIRQDDSYTGGAHENPTIAGVMWDQRTKRRLPMAALFRPDADFGRLDAVLCRAVKAAKAKRAGAAALDGETWRCPAWAQASAVLAPSTRVGRTGGLVVLINVNEVGPFSEGAYRVLVPRAEFAPALRPAYAAEFGGEPSPRAKVLLDDPE